VVVRVGVVVAAAAGVVGIAEIVVEIAEIAVGTAGVVVVVPVAVGLPLALLRVISIVGARGWRRVGVPVLVDKGGGNKLE
jgi:hypothetical protein